MLTLLISAAIAAFSTAPDAGSDGGKVYRIVAYTRDQLHVYDENGVLQPGVIPAKSLPTPAPILRLSHEHLGILFNGKLIYLRNAEVKTVDLPPICAPLAVSTRKAGAVVAATASGVNAGLNEHGVSCVKAGE